MTTTLDPTVIRRYDHLSPVEAIVLAWTQPATDRHQHREAQRHVAELTPRLAATLEHLALGWGVRRSLVASALEVPLSKRRRFAGLLPVVAHNIDRLIEQERRP